MNKANHPEMTWQQIGCMYIVIAVVAGVFWLRGGCVSRQTPEEQAERQKQKEQFQSEIQQLDAELQHPAVKQAFESGYLFGMTQKKSGLAKLSEHELDAYALAACDELMVPKELRGHAVRKFKSGFGWGYLNKQ